MAAQLTRDRDLEMEAMALSSLGKIYDKVGGLTKSIVRDLPDSLVGLVVKASASRAEDPGFESRLRLDFSGSSHTSDLKIGTPVATLPGAWKL